MDLIKHQSNGANGLRIAATTIIILGWLSFVVLILIALGTLSDPYFLVLLIYALLSLGGSYLTACLLRALASLAEAAQLYYDSTVFGNSKEQDITEESE